MADLRTGPLSGQAAVSSLLRHPSLLACHSGAAFGAAHWKKREHLIELAWFLIHGLVGDTEMIVLLTTVPTICMLTPDDEEAPQGNRASTGRSVCAARKTTLQGRKHTGL